METMSHHVHTADCDHRQDHVCWGGGQVHDHHHRLEVIDLSVSYREVKAIEHIQFQTECGRSIALIGPNGAGKSTLLKSLAGLIKPDEGVTRWRGHPLTESSREIAYLPQRGDVDWNFPITVRGLVEMGRYPNLGWWKSYSKHDAEIVERALESMQLHDLQHRLLSGRCWANVHHSQRCQPDRWKPYLCFCSFSTPRRPTERRRAKGSDLCVSGNGD